MALIAVAVAGVAVPKFSWMRPESQPTVVTSLTTPPRPTPTEPRPRVVDTEISDEDHQLMPVSPIGGLGR